MKTRTVSVVAVGAWLILASCTKGSPEAAADSSAVQLPDAAQMAAEVEAARNPSENDRAIPDALPAAAQVQLGGAFAEEAKSRTHEKPEADDVFAAFSAAGVTIAEVKQGLGRTSHAQYCAFGTSPANSRVAVCEYADAATAAAALPKVQAQLADVRRRVEPNGRLLMTVMTATDAAAAVTERDALFATFAGVKAP